MKNILLLTLFSLMATLVVAQEGIIRGTVFDDGFGESVIGANVALAEDPSIGTSTDLDGAFSISVAPGTYTVTVSYIGYQTVSISDVVVTDGEVTVLGEIRISEASEQLEEVVVTAKAIRTTEVALLTVKKKSSVMMDGISSARMQLTGDGTAVEAAKRVTGVSIEGGKYVYVRGLGDRYSKTTLNGVDVPGLDPDRNTLQMDIFPTNLIDNIVISKNFTADMPADFTGGLLNIQTKDFPDEENFSVSVGLSYNPDMHLNSDWLTDVGGDTDFLGYDDGTREIPADALSDNIPTPISGASDQEVTDFVQSFNPNLAAQRENSFLDFSAGLSYGNQSILKNDAKLGYIFSLSYKTNYTFYDDVFYGEYQRNANDETVNELVYANIQEGQLGEKNVLIGVLGGLAYKTKRNKYRLTAMRLQNGESRAAQFSIDDNGSAVGHSGYLAESDNLEYNQRSLTNVLLNGTHVNEETGWEIDWRLSPTWSTLDDPDIRKTAFTTDQVGGPVFNAGAGGNPSRIWRSLSEINAIAKVDFTKDYSLFGEDAKLKFGASHTYKDREYEILFFDVQFFGGNQDWEAADPNLVLDPKNIYPNSPNIYFQSGNSDPNPNQYQSDVNNTGVYVSNEFFPFPKLKTILGVRAENFVQRHTGRDQLAAQGNPEGRSLDNEEVLNSLDFFPTANFIYELTEEQNLRASYSRTIARPSFKELSFAQILDPVTNRIFNGTLFQTGDWDGNLVETRIDNIDLRWERFLPGGQIFSVSAFYKNFDSPIELVRIPEQQTTPEFQPRNVGNGRVYGVEVEVRKNFAFISESLSRLAFSGNVTFVESQIDMTETEFQARKNFEREGENIENTRDMAGQAPYVINAGLTYGDSETGLDIGLFYNVKGETLTIVGSGLYPDIYFQPFHSLNFSINKRLGEDKNTAIDFKVSNILNDKRESFFQSFNADDQIFSRLSPGITFGIGFSHKF
ncbi:MAG: TonB-dependent receptor [Saprospiraceae bacterium]|nr:TonB-dependent receptor [Saprospiraceae bacterium]